MNAELRRNLWLEVTLQRLIAVPVILALVFACAWLVDGRVVGGWTRATALAAYFVIAVVWAARLSAQSLTEELEQGTWDSQRGSSLSAFAMTCGKLMGGPAIAWYGGLWCLLVYAFAAAPSGVVRLVWTLLALVALSVATASAALLGALLLWRRQRSARARQTRALLNLVLLVLLLFFGLHDLPALAHGKLVPVLWYAHAWLAVPFAALSLVGFAGWAFLGAWRLMRVELQYRNTPWVWLAFLLYLTAWCSGWLYTQDRIGAIDFVGLRLPAAMPAVGLGALLCAAATYLTVFVEAKDWLRLRRLRSRWRRSPLRAASDIPLWMASLVATFAFAVAFGVLAVIGLPPENGLAVVAGTATMFCFLLRDLFLVLWLNGADRPSPRADPAALLYLVVLYFLLPNLAFVAQLGELSGLFNPLDGFAQPAWVLAAALEAAVMLALLFYRRRRAHGIGGCAARMRATGR